MPQPRRSVRLFESDLLERLSFASPWLIAAIWAPLILAASTYGALHAPGAAVAIGTAIVALFGWTLFEYAMHRYVFHFRATSRTGVWLLFVLHGCHHAEPQDKRRNVMPPGVTLAIGALFLALFVSLAGAALGCIAFAGFMAGYLAYDLTHYACHQLDLGWMRGLKRRHLAHHFAGQEANYAVTFPLWDRLFGTPLVRSGGVRPTTARVARGRGQIR